jgi:DNA-binding phage protein
MSKFPKMLREVIEEKKISVRCAVKAIGIDHGSLYRALKDDVNPEGKAFEKILNI